MKILWKRSIGTRACGMAGLLLLVLGLVVLGGCGRSDRTLSHGRFDQVSVVGPIQDPEAVVLLLSGAKGIGDRDRALADTLSGQGALVALIDTHALLASLAADGDDCSYPDGDLENLAHYIEAAYSLPGYRPPILAGTGEGGALALAIMAQANTAIFAGALSTDFSPRITGKARLCAEGALKSRPTAHGFTLTPADALKLPWYVQQPDRSTTHAVRGFVSATGHATLLAASVPGRGGTGDQSLVKAFRSLKASQQAKATAPLPASVAGLPLIIVNAKKTDRHPHTMAILMSGDGGWAGLDKDIGHAIAKAGIPVVGYDTLRYYWKSRTPDEATHDLSRVMRFYGKRWHRSKVLLIGYSLGADVMPFIINRMAPAKRRTITRAVMLGLGSHVTFQFKIWSWFGFDSQGQPIRPEAEKLPPGLGVCIYGTDDDDSICQTLNRKDMQQIPLAGGHHFDGNYQHIARLILNALRERDRKRAPMRPAGSASGNNDPG